MLEEVTAGCPNCRPAVERVQKVLVSESLRADIEGIPMSSEVAAKALEFPGSPTIRVNGTDVEPTHKNTTGLACQLYANGGVPSEELLRLAFSRAREREGARESQNEQRPWRSRVGQSAGWLAAALWQVRISRWA